MGLLLILFGVAIIALFYWLGKQPHVKDGYFDKVESSMPIEKSTRTKEIMQFHI